MAPRHRDFGRFCLVALAICLGPTTGAPVALGQTGHPTTLAPLLLRKVSPDVLVTLDVFSGRPNPSWSLSAEEEQELVHRLQGLPPTDARPAEGDLGYRGFRLAAPADPSEVVVTPGIVTIRDDKGTHAYVDANGIESWLIELARRHGHGALVEGH